MTELRAFKVFLSHHYKSPETNLFFFNLLAQQAELQFEVDEGVSFQPVGGGEIVRRLPLNVTRLERMVRGADAFIGIYPLSVSPTAAPTRSELLEQSRYFRLELDLAIRSGKPGLVICDQRYKSILDCPGTFFRCTFDAQEVVLGQETPSAAALRKTFSDFCTSVSASNAYWATRGATARGATVGLLLPPLDSNAAGYGPDHIAVLEAALEDNDYKAVRLPWPPVVGLPLLAAVTALDWLIVDVGHPDSAASAAFLHGQFIPAVRLQQLVSDSCGQSKLESALYGGVTVGYTKDIVRWATIAELEAGVRSRIQVIDLPPKRIRTKLEAEDYFSKSAKRPVNVFLSYCGRDATVASEISNALAKRFQKVFDYRDGKSIRPGEPWLREIFDQLATAGVAIPLLSDQYFESGNCEHEAREMIARRDEKELHVIPVKLTPKISVPAWFGDTQYERLFATSRDAEALAQEIVDLVNARAARGATERNPSI